MGVAEVCDLLALRSAEFSAVQRSCDVVGYMAIAGNAGPPFVWAGKMRALGDLASSNS